jgi:hypothetical protein
VKQPDFIELKGNWHIFLKYKGNTELISDKMSKELQKRRNSPKKDQISMDEFFKEVEKFGRKRKKS